INQRRISFGKELSARAEFNGRLGQVDPFDLAIEFFAERSEQLVQPFLPPWIPAAGDPTEWDDLVFVVVVDVLVLPRNPAVINGIALQIARNVHMRRIESHILQLNPEILPVCLQELEIVPDGT